MRRLLSCILFASSMTSIACGGDGFDISAAPPAPEASLDDAGDDAAKEASPDSEAVAADTAIEPDDTTPATPETCSPNECGGCAPLAATVGSACGECGGGKLACDGVDALKCVGATERNKCGGCGVLANDKGALCGACGGGVYVCDGVDATKCSDPVTTPPNTACGTCGTQKTVCASDGKSTYCPKTDDRNACLGCGVLAGAPSTLCGSCGRWTCSSDKTFVSCVEAAPPVGLACGMCMKSKFVCTSPGNTACEQLDDRKLTSWGNTDTAVGTIETTSATRAIGVELPRAKSGPITSLKVNIARLPYACANTTSLPHPDPNCNSCVALFTGQYSCTPRTPTAGMLTARVYLGIALEGVTRSYETGIPAADPSLATAGWLELKLPPGVEPSSTERVYVELESDSSMYQFQWNRTPYSSTSSHRACRRTPGAYSFTCDSSQSRPVQLISNTCDY